MTVARKRLLYIEDDTEAAALVAEELTERGFEVLVVPDGEAGLKEILRLRPDLVLCDVGLPDMSGFQVLERLAVLNPDSADTPFIFLTAMGDRASEMKGRRLGCDDYVTKPVDFERLATIIEVRVGQGARHRAQMRVPLIDRERECLTWSARGRTSVEIANMLKLSKRTVDFHIENACRKLHVATRTQAAAKAAATRLIEP